MAFVLCPFPSLWCPFPSFRVPFSDFSAQIFTLHPLHRMNHMRGQGDQVVQAPTRKEDFVCLRWARLLVPAPKTAEEAYKVGCKKVQGSAQGCGSRDPHAKHSPPPEYKLSERLTEGQSRGHGCGGERQVSDVHLSTNRSQDLL